MTKPESKSESEESNRMWANASFVGVLIIIGVPLWWKTTEVYRVALPYDKISSFEHSPVRVATDLTVLAYDDATADEIAGLVEKTFQDIDIINVRIKKSVIPSRLHRALEAVADEREAAEEVAKLYPLDLHNTFYVVQRRPVFQQTWLAGDRLMFFRDSGSGPTLMRALKEWVYETAVLGGARGEVGEKGDAARRVRFPAGGAYHIVLSVVHPRPDLMNVSFDAEQAMEDYVGSFVDELSVLHDFTLKSQWLYLLDFNFQAKMVEDTSEWGRHFAVHSDRLPQLLTRLEGRAATHAAPRPALNLALYLAPCDAAPLLIHHAGAPVHGAVQAFMSPRWGGVVLSSPPAPVCRLHHDFEPPTRLVMGIFIAHLRELLGITKTESIPEAFLEPLRSVSPRRWELDRLLRLRTVEQITSAQGTLRSLAQLLGEISNIVINDEVGAAIGSAVEGTLAAAELAADGRLVEAYEVSKTAHAAAEAAFTHPSLLALLYFPDDQKYAIYIPLFLPIMFPVVLSLKHLFLWFSGRPVHKDKTD